MKFVLFVEGQTERDSAASFLKRWLDPQLSQPIGMQVVSFDGYADLVRKMVTKAHMHLDGPKRNEIVAVVGLLDLYGPDFYPPDRRTADERYVWAKAHFEKEVGLDKFRMFFAVHEFEAWLLSAPDIFPRDIGRALQGKISQPEQVDFDSPPHKLLNQLYKQHTKRQYKKTTYGKQLFAQLDPTAAATKCPYLQKMLNEMLELAKSAGL